MSNQVLVDSSYLYALYNPGDQRHNRALAFAKTTSTVPLVPVVVLPEVAYLFLRDVGHHAIVRFLKQFVAAQTELQQVMLVDIQRAQEIMTAYPEAQFDVVDCCIMALAERLNITQICTFDQRDFRIFRPHHCDHLELTP